MDKFVITGGAPLHGEIPTSGSKNSALPALADKNLAQTVEIVLKRAADGSVITPDDNLAPLDQSTVLVDRAISGHERTFPSDDRIIGLRPRPAFRPGDLCAVEEFPGAPHHAGNLRFDL